MHNLYSDIDLPSIPSFECSLSFTVQILRSQQTVTTTVTKQTSKQILLIKCHLCCHMSLVLSCLMAMHKFGNHILACDRDSSPIRLVVTTLSDRLVSYQKAYSVSNEHLLRHNIDIS